MAQTALAEPHGPPCQMWTAASFLIGLMPCSSMLPTPPPPPGTSKTLWLRRHRPLTYLKIQALTIMAGLVMLARIWLDPRTRVQ